MVHSYQLEDGEVSLYADKEGRFLIRVLEARSGEVAISRYQPVQFVGSGMCFSVIECDKGNITFKINEGVLSENSDQVIQCQLGGAVIGGITSYNDPQALSTCSVWMNRRQSIQFVKQAKSGRRMSTLAEQVEDLRTSIKTLKRLLVEVKTDAKGFLPHICGSLRALVYTSPKSNSQLNPLLFRLAALKNLPLPVYAVTLDLSAFPIQQGVVFVPTLVGTNRKNQGQDLIDLQELLDAEVFSEDDPAVGRYTINRLIAEYSNTMGVAHYDLDRNIAVDRLSSFMHSHRTAFQELVLEIAQAIVDLGEYVIREYR